MKTLLLSFLFFLGLTLPTEAQFNQETVEPMNTIEVSPKYPQPGETIKASLSDTSRNYGSSIYWYVNDELIEEFTNQRYITIENDPEETKKKITALLVNQKGYKTKIDNTVNFKYLDIILEPQTRTPDFYFGRGLPSVGSTVNATAIMSDTESDNFIYRWQVNRDVVGGGAALGQKQVSFVVPNGQSFVLSLEISKPNGQTVFGRTIEIGTFIPEIHFYEVNPLYGISQRSAENYINLSGKSTIVKAEPYNLDIKTYNDPDVSEWSIGRAKVVSPHNPYETTIQRVDGLSSVEINFQVQSLSKFLQGTKNSVKVNF